MIGVKKMEIFLVSRMLCLDIVYCIWFCNVVGIFGILFGVLVLLIKLGEVVGWMIVMFREELGFFYEVKVIFVGYDYMVGVCVL